MTFCLRAWESRQCHNQEHQLGTMGLFAAWQPLLNYWCPSLPRDLPLLTNRTPYENLKRQRSAISCPIITLFFCHLSSKSISLIGISWEMEQLVEPSPGQENWRPRVRPWPESWVNSWSLSEAELDGRWLSELLKHNREKNLFPPYWDSNAPAPLATSLKFP